MPSECIDLANLLLTDGKRVNKRDFFNSNEELLPGALEKLQDIFKGRVSYARNQNPKLFPARIIVGEKVPNIPYLRFIRCPMSEYHAATYNKVFNGSLSQDAQYLSDFCLPNPDYDTEKLGMFQTELVKQKLKQATQKWKDHNSIDYQDELITGEFMQLPGLSKYSAKYATAMKDIRYLLQHDQGKMLVYHNNVHMSGVLFIQEMLKQNGFIDETSSPNENTLCQICGREKRFHKNGIAIANIKPMMSPEIEDEGTVEGGHDSDSDSSSDDDGCSHPAEKLKYHDPSPAKIEINKFGIYVQSEGKRVLEERKTKYDYLCKSLKITSSWRSKSANLIPIVTKYGGGGHMNACGLLLNDELLHNLGFVRQHIPINLKHHEATNYTFFIFMIVFLISYLYENICNKI
jgi:hypothetical protein